MSDPLDQVTPLILTYNEEANIGRSLEGLRWAKRIVVIDSGSTDRTLEILASFPQIDIIHRPFDSFSEQGNFGLRQISTAWVLSLDADHLITPGFLKELAQVIAEAPADLDGVVTPFHYCVYGKPIRCGMLPPRINVMRPNGGSYRQDGHAHQFEVLRRSVAMVQPVLHDDRKPLSRWLEAQQRYLEQETNKIRHTPQGELGLADRIRKLHLIAPFAVPFIILVAKGGLFDGWRGWFYAFQRMYVETLLSLMLWEARRGGGGAMEAPEQL